MTRKTTPISKVISRNHLRNLIITETRPELADLVNPKLSGLNLRAKYGAVIPSTLEELHTYKNHYWVWFGTYKHNKPVLNHKSVVRTLYSLLRVPIDNTRWRLTALPDTDHWDVNPYRYKLANGYDLLLEDEPSIELTDDVNDIIEYIKDMHPTGDLPPITQLASNLGNLYSVEDIESACKELGRTMVI